VRSGSPDPSGRLRGGAWPVATSSALTNSSDTWSTRCKIRPFTRDLVLVVPTVQPSEGSSRAPSTSSTPSRFSVSRRSSSPTSKSISRSRRSCVSSQRRCARGRILVCALRRSPAFRPRRAMFVRRPRSSRLGPRLGQRGRLRTSDSSSVTSLVPSLVAGPRTLRRVLPRGGVWPGAP
jgi:hypothetical protein